MSNKQQSDKYLSFVCKSSNINTYIRSVIKTGRQPFNSNDYIFMLAAFPNEKDIILRCIEGSLQEVRYEVKVLNSLRRKVEKSLW